MMGREDNGNKRRGMCPVHDLVHAGVTATFATNNIQNLFTFTGDGDMLKIGTLFCQIAHLSSENGALLCLKMATEIAAKALGVDHFLGENRPADIVILGGGDGMLGSYSQSLSQSYLSTGTESNTPSSSDLQSTLSQTQAHPDTSSNLYIDSLNPEGCQTDKNTHFNILTLTVTHRKTLILAPTLAHTLPSFCNDVAERPTCRPYRHKKGQNSFSDCQPDSHLQVIDRR
jgi:Amidohydrolase family